MTDLHALYAARSIGKFRSFLRSGGGTRGAGGGGGGGGGGSATKIGSLSRSPGVNVNAGMGSASMALEVNRRDHLGRTVLHLAAVEAGEWALEWLELLLSVPLLQVNAVDAESGWSALHRALYAGNIAGARLLLMRDDVDSRLKDHEGLTPFDVYNSTVEGTNPSEAGTSRRELFTWGQNRNYVLGFPGDGDRAVPERVQLKRAGAQQGFGAFEPLRIRDVSMARLHTGIVTDEERNNIRFCGYGTGGRLGPTTQTQFTFAPLQDFPHSVASVVLSPDHTVVVTSSGAVWTFGLNRAAQLGYVLEGPPADEPIQSVPRRVVGLLKKEIVLGAAASRMHTAVFTANALYTWGSNRGQLGYPAAGAETQVLPRKVTAVAFPIVQLCATENATACLLASKDVLVLYHEGYLKIVFPLARFPSKMQAYRPPQVSSKPNIEKLASCGNTFAALSSLGDVFFFTLDTATKSGSDSAGALARVAPKPQRIWSLRRKFTAVTDVSVGLDGTIILCTVSGHVFVRTKRFEAASGAAVKNGVTSSSGWKFSRVPYLQRVVKVAANSTGAFAAIRADVPLLEIEVEGQTLAENLLGILPHWRRVGPVAVKIGGRKKAVVDTDEDLDEAEADAGVEQNVQVALQMLKVLDEWDEGWTQPLAGSDFYVVAGRLRIPVHGLILSLRSTTLARLVRARHPIELQCSELTALLFIHYIYSDDTTPIWDSLVGSRVREARPTAVLNLGAVKTELMGLATDFDLQALTTSLQYHIRTAPAPTLLPAVRLLLASAGSTIPLPSADIVLDLADREVHCQSVILRARCTVFETFYEDVEWTALRIDQNVVRFDLKHIGWDVMRLVLEHIYCDAGEELFETINYPTSDEYIDFVTLVLAAANELLLDKLKLVCASVLRRFVTLHNVCAILVDAAFYEVHDLVRACMLFIVSSMETVLEGRLLDDLPPDLVAAVSRFCQERQGARMPISRSGLLVNELMKKHASWHADLDLAKPTGGARKFRPILPRSPGPSPSLLSPGPSPGLHARGSPRVQPQISPNSSPSLQPLRESMDEPFAMDDDFSLDASPTRIAFGTPINRRVSSGQPNSPSTTSFTSLNSPPPPRLQPWAKVTSETAKTPLDLRGIMATEAATRLRPSSEPRSGPSTPLPRTAAPPVAMASSSQLSSTPSSWRSLDAARPSLANIQSEQGTRPPLSRPRTEPSRPVTQRNPSSTAPPPNSPQPSSSAFGAPVISPVRNGTRSGARTPNASFGAADIPWTNFTVAPSSTPPLDPAFLAPSSPPLASFALIQSQQRAELDAIKSTKAPRSFADVMAQEATEAQQRAEAEEFDRWWAAESERVRAEEATAAIRGSGKQRGSGGAVRGGKGRGGGAKPKGSSENVSPRSAGSTNRKRGGGSGKTPSIVPNP